MNKWIIDEYNFVMQHLDLYKEDAKIKLNKLKSKPKSDNERKNIRTKMLIEEVESFINEFNGSDNELVITYLSHLAPDIRRGEGCNHTHVLSKLTMAEVWGKR
jgi:ubiquitin C-terminal hydrolase